MIKELALGIDIGGTNIVCGLVDKKGNLIAEGSCSMADFDTPEEMMVSISEKFHEMKSNLKTNQKIVGIGIGAPNGNFFNGCIENAPNLKWKGKIPLVKLFKKNFKLPVYLTNDANAAALGEMIYGGAKKMKDFIVITIGTGLGSGIVANGKLIYGHDGLAGELGHTIYQPGGRKCGCGRLGCLETYVSSSGLIKTTKELLEKNNTKSLLRKLKPNEIISINIQAAAIKGDKLAINAYEITGAILGQKLADAVAVTSPEAIFLFGGISRSGNLLIKPAKKALEENLLSVYKNKVKILQSELLDKNAAVLGAAAMVWCEK
jgi:glucokinase